MSESVFIGDVVEVTLKGGHWLVTVATSANPAGDFQFTTTERPPRCGSTARITVSIEDAG